MNTRKAVVNIAILILTLIAIRACLPQKVNLGNTNHHSAGQKIVIIPTEGIPTLFLHEVERRLEEAHKTDVLITTAMGVGDEMLMPNNQYNANLLATTGDNIAARIGRKKSFIIVLTNEDINYPNSGLRFVFSAHYDGEISVISLARTDKMTRGVLPSIVQVPILFNKMQDRALKLINKAIGFGVYNYKTSSNFDSVMYGPIMGIDDLDNIGDWY